jgi:hypothetical protein
VRVLEKHAVIFAIGMILALLGGITVFGMVIGLVTVTGSSGEALGVLLFFCGLISLLSGIAFVLIASALK